MASNRSLVEFASLSYGATDTGIEELLKLVRRPALGRQEERSPVIAACEILAQLVLENTRSTVSTTLRYPESTGHCAGADHDVLAIAVGVVERHALVRLGVECKPNKIATRLHLEDPAAGGF